MNRPYSWFPLAGSDPVPGEPGAVRTAGDHYAEVADAIASGARVLREVAELDGTVSDAVAAVRTAAGEVAEQITAAEHRYRTVAAALAGYAAELDQAQEDSLSALTSAQSAQHVIDEASTQIAYASRSLADATEDDETSFQQVRLRRARASRDAADIGLTRAREELERAVESRDRAARVALEAIDGATSGDGLGDGWWENWGRAVTTAVSHVAGAVAAVAGIAALFLGWVPGLGQVLALVSLVAGSVVLVADAILLKQDGGSAMNVVLDLVGLLTLGIGRLVSISAKASSCTLRGVVTTRAVSRAARSGNPAVRGNPERLVPALGGGDVRPAGVTRAQWAQTLGAEIRGLPPLSRAAARLGEQGLALDLAAVRRAEALGKGSTVVADALRSADAVSNAAVATGAAGGVASGWVVHNELRWVHDLATRDPDPVRLGR